MVMKSPPRAGSLKAQQQQQPSHPSRASSDPLSPNLTSSSATIRRRRTSVSSLANFHLALSTPAAVAAAPSSLSSPSPPPTPPTTTTTSLSVLKSSSSAAAAAAAARPRMPAGVGMLRFGQLSAVDQERIQISIEDRLLADLDSTKAFEFPDVLSLMHDGACVVVEDDFSRCFEMTPDDHWNWNYYLFVLWYFGWFVRHFILFPIRVIVLLVGFIMFMALLALTHVKALGTIERRQGWQRALIKFMCGVFVLSWAGVIKYHGIFPKHKANQIYVANHSSLIDMIILSQKNTFSVVGQQHTGIVGFCQDYILSCLKCVWFNRKAKADRASSSCIIKDHVANAENNPLLIFPEGTCVNNEYVVQFKKGAFEMGCTVVPIAIKYNKIFVDGYWNSRAKSFLWHLADLMTSWAVVCDVWYLEPQTMMPNESSIEFAGRVKQMIAQTAGLIPVDWDGYMKYFTPSQRYVQKRQKVLASTVLRAYGNINSVRHDDADDNDDVKR